MLLDFVHVPMFFLILFFSKKNQKTNATSIYELHQIILISHSFLSDAARGILMRCPLSSSLLRFIFATMLSSILMQSFYNFL